MGGSSCVLLSTSHVPGYGTTHIAYYPDEQCGLHYDQSFRPKRISSCISSGGPVSDAIQDVGHHFLFSVVYMVTGNYLTMY